MEFEHFWKACLILNCCTVYLDIQVTFWLRKRMKLSLFHFLFGSSAWKKLYTCISHGYSSPEAQIVNILLVVFIFWGKLVANKCFIKVRTLPIFYSLIILWILFLVVQHDVFLICSNAMQYNPPNTIYHKQVGAVLFQFVVLTLKVAADLFIYLERHGPSKSWQQRNSIR